MLSIHWIMGQHTRNGEVPARDVIAVKGARGFSIVEAMFAILILAITLAGGLAFYFYANDLYARRLHARLATSLAEDRMERCASARAGGLPTASGGACPLETNAATGDTLQGIATRRTVTVTADGTGKDVAVYICWCEPGGACDAAACNGSSRSYVVMETIAGP